MKSLKTLAVAALLFAIGGCSAGNVLYYQVALESSSTAATGTDCPGIGNDVITLTGIDGVDTWAIYSAPNSQYLLDGAVSGELLTGTLSGGTYTFSSSVIVDSTAGNTQTTITIKTTVSLTPTGPGATGTITIEQICSSGNGTNCGNGEVSAACGDANGVCGTYTTGSADSADFDCTSQASVVATQISNVTPIHGESASSAASASTTAGNNGGNGTAGNGGFASGTWSGTATASINGVAGAGVADTETLVNLSSSFEFTNYLGWTGCTPLFSISGNSASLELSADCFDTQGDEYDFSTGTATVSGTSMTVNMTGTYTQSGSTNSESLAVSENLTGP
jgi:hypothetical protein